MKFRHFWSYGDTLDALGTSHCICRRSRTIRDVPRSKFSVRASSKFEIWLWSNFKIPGVPSTEVSCADVSSRIFEIGFEISLEKILGWSWTTGMSKRGRRGYTVQIILKSKFIKYSGDLGWYAEFLLRIDLQTLLGKATARMCLLDFSVANIYCKLKNCKVHKGK